MVVIRIYFFEPPGLRLDYEKIVAYACSDFDGMDVGLTF